MRGKWLLFAGVVILSAAGAGALGWYFRSVEAPREAADEAPPAPVREAVTLAGKVRAQDMVGVDAPIEGTVDALFVEVGQEVFQDQLLATITSTALESARDAIRAERDRARDRVSSIESQLVATRLEAARARALARRASIEHEAAKKTYERQRMLHSEGATPRLKFEASERDYQKAELEFSSLDQLATSAENRVDGMIKELEGAKYLERESNLALEEAEAHLRAGQVLSPVDGWVAAVGVRPGDALRPDGPDPIQIALSLGVLEVVVAPDPATLERVRPGQTVTIHILEAAATIPGTVKEIREDEAVIEFVNHEGVVQLGNTAEVRIELEP